MLIHMEEFFQGTLTLENVKQLLQQTKSKALNMEQAIKTGLVHSAVSLF